MSAAEHSILSADAYVHEIMRAAEAQAPASAVFSRRTFLKLTGVAGTQVDLIRRAIETKGHGLSCLTTVDVVDQ